MKLVIALKKLFSLHMGIVDPLRLRRKSFTACYSADRPHDPQEFILQDEIMRGYLQFQVLLLKDFLQSFCTTVLASWMRKSWNWAYFRCLRIWNCRATQKWKLTTRYTSLPFVADKYQLTRLHTFPHQEYDITIFRFTMDFFRQYCFIDNLFGDS